MKGHNKQQKNENKSEKRMIYPLLGFFNKGD